MVFIRNLMLRVSPFRVSVDFIYRVLDYYIASGSSSNMKLGNLVLGGGLTWAPHNDFNVFIKGDGAVYTFSLGKTEAGLSNFMF